MRTDYMQHNPNAETGVAGFKAYFSRLGGPLPIEPKIKRQVISIVAAGELVVLSFVQDNKDSKGQPYKTTWFDMFRIQDEKSPNTGTPRRSPDPLFARVRPSGYNGGTAAREQGNHKCQRSEQSESVWELSSLY
jgi:hypothetical protein